MPRIFIALLAALLAAACTEKPQDRSAYTELSDATARGAADPLDERTRTQNEANRINY